MIIHPSHSKKDLIELCDVFNIEILDIHDLSKMSLVLTISKILEKIDYIEPENDYYFIDTIEDLKRYLTEPNQAKNLSITEKERLIKISRDIISYCKSNYNLYPYFKSEEHLILQARAIQPHCDISTCRRALNMLLNDRSLPDKINPVLSNRIKKQIEKKELLKKESSGKLKVRKGKFKISFD